MKVRDSKKYRHKGLRTTHVNTVMGEIKFKRAMYEVKEEGITKTVYLLDEKLKKLEKYLSKDLERYQDVLEVPEAPEGIEYKFMKEIAKIKSFSEI